MKRCGTWKLCAALALTAALFSACSRAPVYRDGRYEQQSRFTDEKGGYGIVKIEVSEGAITRCEFSTFNADGSLKDESYGKNAGQSHLYAVAQKALATCDEYAASLVKTQNLETVDAISGATDNYRIFIDASSMILEDIKTEKK